MPETDDDLIEVELPENEDEDVVEQEEEAAKDDGSVDSSEEDAKPVVKKRKRGNNGTKQIKEQWAKLKDAERARLAAENTANAEAERAGKLETITGTALENQLTTARELAMYKLKDAKERDDIDAEIKFQAEISAIDARTLQLRQYKSDNENRAKAPPAQEAVVADTLDAFYEQGTPARKRWVDANREWLDESSDNYDAEKLEDIRAYGLNLERELAQQGRGAEIDTLAYYKRLDKYIAENWSDDDMEEESAPPPKKGFGAKATSTPVGSRSANGATAKPAAVKLSKSDLDFALSNTHWRNPNGTLMSDQERIQFHAKNKLSTPQEGTIAAKTHRGA